MEDLSHHIYTQQSDNSQSILPACGNTDTSTSEQAKMRAKTLHRNVGALRVLYLLLGSVVQESSPVSGSRFTFD